MNDRGEKIVNLAREVLCSEFDHEAPNLTTPNKSSFSLKTVCFVALLAGFGGGGIAHLLEETHRPANRYERVEIDALIFYAAREKALNEAQLRAEIQDDLALSSLDAMTVEDYKNARTLLWTKLR